MRYHHAVCRSRLRSLEGIKQRVLTIRVWTLQIYINVTSISLLPSEAHTRSHTPLFQLPTVMAVYCDRCSRWFRHDRAFEQHKEDSNSHWPCDDCDLDFGSDDDLRQHYIQDSDHHYCKECDKHFNFEESRRQHMDAKHWYCEQHDRVSTRYQ
jgi:hypothetical protein